MSIPFSERVHNWVSSLVAIWPIIIALVGGTLYGNSETVKRLVHGEPEIPEGELVDVKESDVYAAAIKAINEKLKKHDAALESLDQARRGGDSNLEQRVLKLEQHH